MALPRWLGLLPRLGAWLLVASCQAGPSASSPPEIVYGLDECVHCRMTIDEPRFAAASTDRERDALRYDDIGCLLKAHAGPAGESAALWVHDFETEAWLSASAAWFVEVPDLPTPMGSGLIAFGSASRATAFAAAATGEILRWDPESTRLEPLQLEE